VSRPIAVTVISLVGGVLSYVQVSYFGIIDLCSPDHDLPIAAFGFSTPL
jgi:hypothetical protein